MADKRRELPTQKPTHPPPAAMPPMAVIKKIKK
jgi:hypothetical protein